MIDKIDKKVEKKIKKFTNFKKLFFEIARKNLFQKKAIKKIILSNSFDYLKNSEDVTKRILKVARKIKKNINIKSLSEIYLWYTDLLKKEELYFEKYKSYRNKSYKKVFKEVYNRPDYMFRYAIGLGISQLFWENHIKVFDFFKKNLVNKIQPKPVIAEIGMGHGLFTSEVLKNTKSATSIMIDISDMCLQFAKNMADISGSGKNRILVRKKDIQKEIPIEDNSLDVLLLGEVIEHLAKGKEVMKKLSKKIKKDGLCYFSTPANGPAEDHILLFTKVSQIRKFIKDCSWKIIKEAPITLNKMSVDLAEKKSKVINYCAILKRA